MRFLILVALCVGTVQLVFCQDTSKVAPPATVKTAKKWYEAINLRGYTQVRYNRLLETNPDLKCEQCDRSWGKNGGFYFRRIRLIFSGNIHDRVFFYIQPDFAGAIDKTLNIAQIRDAYFDLALDKKKAYRFRIGQSKVPYGFENLQSSQNRLPLDRADALNSAFPNERDLGIFFYWAPPAVRERFSHLVSSGLKGSGDYGVAGIGVFNGQVANRPEANDGLHAVARFSYPFEFKNGQIFEPGIQAYSGKAVVTSVTAGVSGKENYEYTDRRLAGTLVWFAKPFGLAAEYNYGTGPEYNPQTNAIEQKTLHGGYVLASYMLKLKEQVLIPFTRYQYYHGGKKQELDARKHRVKELETGVEWQPIKNFELVAMYTVSDRTFEDGALTQNHQKGRLLRLQFQLNF
ncbi:porin [Sphingobacteriales bacterium UPWRP_1]|nr:porin [Sphingobacteriales bacterium TSM_CSM]PSJ74797.1 porin [Sphingobacteriales bacterium UPWRP_1]